MTTFSKSSQRGYSLIELSIALAIVGVVIAGSIVGVQSILQSNNVNRTIKQTNTAVNKVVAKLVRDPNYANATLENLTRRGMDVWEPGDITDGGTATAAVTHPLASNVFVRPLSETLGGLDANQGYIYTLTGVPVTACTDLSVGLEGLGTVMSITNQSPISAAPGTLTANKVKTTGSPYNSALANQYCSGSSGAAAVVDQATISFLVPRR